VKPSESPPILVRELLDEVERLVEHSVPKLLETCPAGAPREAIEAFRIEILLAMHPLRRAQLELTTAVE